MTDIPSGSHFVFVHGAFHGAWCWYKIKCLLESAGHKVTCIDLACAGIDPSDPNTMSSFEEYNKPLDDVISGLGDNDKVILVGHSAGGSNITAALYKYTGKIQVAVYLVAKMLRNNSWNEGYMSQENHMMVGRGGYTNNDEIYDYVYGDGPNEPATSIMIKKQFQRHRFYERSPLQDSTLAGMLLKPVPIRALQGGELPDVGKDVDKVPRVYIKTLDDNTFSEKAQDDMIAKWQPCDVYSVESDHSAFFSAPVELFGILHKVATKYSFAGYSSQGTKASIQKSIWDTGKGLNELEQVGRIRGRQNAHKLVNEGEQVVTIDYEVKGKNENAFGSKETREAFRRIYNGLKILMILSVWIVITLVLILATKA